MKTTLFTILALLYSLSSYAQISIDRDSLIIDPSKDEFTQETDTDGVYKIIPKIYELSSDENGEFFFSIFAGIWKSIIQKRKFFKTIVNTFRNEVKIYGGIFITNKHKNFLGRSWELLSRITWQLPQTIMGETYSIVRNWVGLVDRVEYRFGATFAINEYSSKRDGMTLGSYININDKGLMPKDDNGKFAPEKDQLYMHEYGHYMQSQIYGWAYVPCIGAPSLVSAMKSKIISGKGYTTHSVRWYEMDASRRGKEYFQKYYNIPWNENDNPTHKPENTKLKY